MSEYCVQSMRLMRCVLVAFIIYWNCWNSITIGWFNIILSTSSPMLRLNMEHVAVGSTVDVLPSNGKQHLIGGSGFWMNDPYAQIICLIYYFSGFSSVQIKRLHALRGFFFIFVFHAVFWFPLVRTISPWLASESHFRALRRHSWLVLGCGLHLRAEAVFLWMNRTQFRVGPQAWFFCTFYCNPPTGPIGNESQKN